jgi:hypothetical protein
VGTASTIIAPESVDDYGLPVLVADTYDNLHLLMTGKKSIPTAEDVFHTYYDAPPHISNLTFLRNQSNQDSVVIDWDGMNEPDLHTYKVFRKMPSGQWQFVDSTLATRYADTNVSYIVPCFDNKITEYYVKAIDDAYQSAYSDTLEIWCVRSGKISAGNLAELIDLQNNYPNPFNSQTTIQYNVPFEMQVTLEIYDILGRKIETLVDEYQSAGSYAVVWNADNFASGMYFYRLQAGEYSGTKRMTIIK